MILRTRQSAPDCRISLRHSCPHPARSGHREHSLKRNCGVLPSVAVRLLATSTATPAGRLVSGHVTTRGPRNFHQIAPTRQIARQATNPTPSVINDMGIPYSGIASASQSPLLKTAENQAFWGIPKRALIQSLFAGGLSGAF